MAYWSSLSASAIARRLCRASLITRWQPAMQATSRRSPAACAGQCRRRSAPSAAAAAFTAATAALRRPAVHARRQRAASLRASSSSSDTASSSYGEVCSLKCCLLDVPGDVAEEVAEVLLAYGAQSALVEEYRAAGAQEQEIFADRGGAAADWGAGAEAAARVWDRCSVVAYFPPELDGAALLSQAAAHFGLAGCQVEVEAVRTQDWEQSIRDSYQPAQVGDGLWIVPVWSAPPDPAATNIRLEPGLAFGTGDHPTTRLCLRWLQRLQRGGSLGGGATALMDYGTGSGVLAVAALLLGCERAVATDIDPLAIKSAAANARLNGMEQRLAAYQCQANLDQPEPLAAAGVPAEQRTFGITVANILQGPLVALAPRLAAYTQPGGLLGLSGVLAEQAPAVMDAYRPWFQDFQVEGEDRWALVTAVRRSDGRDSGL